MEVGASSWYEPSEKEFRVFATGIYSITAFFAASLVQLLAADNPKPDAFRHMAALAGVLGPLLMVTLALDFHCVGKPYMRRVAVFLYVLLGALVGAAIQFFERILELYAAGVGQRFAYGLYIGLAVAIAIQLLSGWMRRRAARTAAEPPTG